MIFTQRARSELEHVRRLTSPADAEGDCGDASPGWNQAVTPSVEMIIAEDPSADRPKRVKEEISMKKLGLIGIVAGALSTAVIGFAGPAQADGNGSGNGGRDRDSSYYGDDRGNNPWADQLIPIVKVPRVDTSVRN